MPNCFTLTRKTDPQAGPVAFAVIDAEMCKYFGVDCDGKKYYEDWYTWVGLNAALGVPLAQIRPADERHAAIVKWLDDNFTTDGWAEIGGRVDAGE
jgi:hypothetical protein